MKKALRILAVLKVIPHHLADIAREKLKYVYTGNC